MPAGRSRAPRGLRVLSVVVLAGCHHAAEPPGPGTSQGVPPDLRGRRVMVLPLQMGRAAEGDADAEIAFALRSKSPDVIWILPDDIERALARSPSIQARTRGLSVGQFLSAEVMRVGDPLYGELVRMAALVDGEVALVPIRLSEEAEAGGEPRSVLSAALIHVGTGRVLWFGIVEGEPVSTGPARALASAVDALARTLLWYVGA